MKDLKDLSWEELLEATSEDTLRAERCRDNAKFAGDIRGEMLKEEDRSYLYTDEVNARRNKTISKDRYDNPLNQNETWMKSMQKDEKWTQAIRDAKQVQIIQQCDMDGKVIKEWPSYKVIEDNTPFTRSSIYKAVKGKKKRGNPNEAYGFLWFSKSK